MLLGTLLSLLPLCAPQESFDEAVRAARAYREAHGAAILRGFAELLALPNVASDLDDQYANARAIAALLAERGARTELFELGGAPPIVYGRLDAAGAERTLGIYVHYDGQPVDPAAWRHGPFEPVLYTREPRAGGVPRDFPTEGEAIDPEWRIYARSAGDDKAPIPALCAALDALDGAGIARTSNLVFLFEGEEEAGSPHLGTYLEQHAEELAVDAWLICDGPVHQSRRPQLVFGVRGIVGFELTVYGANRELHSGHYGNWAPNPGLMLAQLLASMKDADGTTLVAGFAEAAEQVGPAERAALATVPEVDEELKQELGLARTEGGAPLAERLLHPSLNIRGIRCADVGAGSRNVVPSTATASLDIRLVAGNDPQEMVELVAAHVRAQGYHVVDEDPDLATRLAHPRIAKLARGGGYRAARTRMDDPIVMPLARAVRRATGEDPILVPSLGGSLPLYLFEELGDAPLVIFPIANHDDNQHAPEENLRVGNLWYGVEVLAAVFTM